MVGVEEVVAYHVTDLDIVCCLYRHQYQDPRPMVLVLRCLTMGTICMKSFHRGGEHVVLRMMIQNQLFGYRVRRGDRGK